MCTWVCQVYLASTLVPQDHQEIEWNYLAIAEIVFSYDHNSDDDIKVSILLLSMRTRLLEESMLFMDSSSTDRIRATTLR